MLEKYLEEHFGKMDLTEEQKQQFLEMIYQITEDDTLLFELQKRKSLLEEGEQVPETFVFDDPNDSSTMIFDLGGEDESQEGGTIEFDLGDTFDLTSGGEEKSAIEESKDSAEKIGRYLDLGVLGIGGMGEVRKVKDEVLNRSLAMKIVHPNILKNKNALARFIEEAQVGAQLQHPNIVPVHELGTLSDGRYYFTMKEIRGKEFTELIYDVHQVSTEQVWKTTADGTTFRRLIQVFHTICETMAYAHSLGVIHRDLKPENVMIGGFGEVLVVDWGIAKILGQTEENMEEFVETNNVEVGRMVTRMGMVAGTPAYMSPEQAHGDIKKLSFQSDVYTLGAILYEILSGQPPYSGRSAVEVVEKVRKSKPQSLLTGLNSIEEYDLIHVDPHILEENLTGKLPFPLIQICEKAMARNIEDRYSTASELAEDIHDWLEGAQKRDKALKEVDSAIEILNLAREKELVYKENWEQANQAIKSQNFENKNIWTEWLQASEALKEVEQLHRDYRKILQGALVYDQELEEANEALAKLVLEDILIAIAKGEKGQQDILERQFQKYLQYLSKRKQEEMNALLELKRQDDIQLLRAQRGELVGRQFLRKEITKTLQKKSHLVSLVGTAGVGKTRLALEVIHDLQESETQTYFCNLTEATSELGVALFVARAMNIKLRNVDPIGQLGEIFAKNKTMLVLDNLEQVVEDVGRVITRWMEQAESLRIIATSRIKLRLEQEHSFAIQPLSLLEGMELFAKRGKKADGRFELNEETRDTVGHLVLQLDSLPLAIELAAARLNIFSVEEVAERLKERFSLLRSRDKGTQALQGALDWSWDLLKPWAKAALSQSSVFIGGFDVLAAEIVLDCVDWKEAPPIFDILQDLSDDSLLLRQKTPDGNIRYGMLESIRQYSRGKLTDEEALKGEFSGAIANRNTELRHAEYFSQFGKKEFLDQLDNQGNQQAWNIFFEELDNFIVGIEYGVGKTASLCCMAAVKILGMKGPMSLGVDVVEKTLEKTDLSRREKKQLEIIRSRFLRISGRMDEARGKQQQEKKKFEAGKEERELSRQKKADLQIRADELLEKGNLEEAESNYDEALEYYNQALQTYQQIEEAKGIIETKQKIATVFEIQGEYEKAQTELEEGLQVAKKDNLVAITAGLYDSLGNIYQKMSDYEQAFEALNRALGINRKLNNRVGEAKVLGSLGDLHKVLFQYDEAVRFTNEALQIARKIGDRRSEGQHLRCLGNIYQQQERFEEATPYFEQAIEIAQEIGDKKLEGELFAGLATVYAAFRKPEEAVNNYQKAIQILHEIGDREGESTTTGNLGILYDEAFDDFERASKCHQEALRIAEEIGLRRYQGICICRQACVLEKQNKVEEAILHHKQANKILLETGEKRYGGFNLGMLGQLFWKQGRIEEAKEKLHQAIELCEEVGEQNLGSLAGLLAFIYAKENNPQKARVFLEKAEQNIHFHPLMKINFYAQRAKILHFLGQSIEAKASLQKSKKIAEEFNLEEHPISQMGLAEIEALLLGEEEISNPSKKDGGKQPKLTKEEIEDLRLEADHLLEKSRLEKAEASYEQALVFIREAQDKYIKITDKKGEAKTYQEIASVLRKQGNIDEALVELEKALEIAEENDLTSNKLDIFSQLGSNYQHKMRYDEALNFFEKALEGYQKTNHRMNEGIAFGNIANVYRRLGKFEESVHFDKQALEIAKEVGNKDQEEVVIGNLGVTYQTLGDFEKALSYSHQALNIAKEIGNKQAEGRHIGNVGVLYWKLNRLEEAKNHFFQAFEIAEEIGDKRQKGLQLGNVGYIYFEQKKYKEAEEVFLKSIPICDQANPLMAGYFKGTLALIYAEEKRFKEAFELLKRAESQVQRSPFKRLNLLGRKAKILCLAQRRGEAEEAMSQAEEIIKELNLKEESDLVKEIAEIKAFINTSSKPLETSKEKEPEGSQLREEQIEDLRLDAEELLEKGNLETEESQYKEALEHYQGSLEIYQKIGEKQGETTARQKIAQVLLLQGKNGQALEALELALEIAEQNQMLQQQANISSTLGNVYLNQSNFEQALQVYQKALGLHQKSNNQASIGIVSGNLGNVYFYLSRFEEAKKYYQQAIKSTRKIGDRHNEGLFLGNLGTIYMNSGDFLEAIIYYQQALEIAKETGKRSSEGTNLGNLGTIYCKLGDLEKADAHYQQALSIAREIGDKQNEGLFLGNVGIVYTRVNQLAEAKDTLEQSIAICEEIYPLGFAVFGGKLAVLYAQENKLEDAFSLLEKGEKYVQAVPVIYGSFLCDKAKVLALSGETEHTTQSFNQAKRIADDLNVEEYSELNQDIIETTAFLLKHRDSSPGTSQLTEDELEDLRIEAEDLVEKGNLEESESQYEKALHYYEQALQIYQKIEDKKGETDSFYKRATIYRALGKYEQSLVELKKGLEITEENGLTAEKADIYSALGGLYSNQSQYEEALEYHHLALEIFQTSNNLLEEGRNLRHIGDVYLNRGRFEPAKSYFEQAIEIARKIGDKRSEGICFRKLGNLCNSIGKLEESIKYSQQAANIASEIGDKSSEGIIFGHIGLAYNLLGQLEKAKNCYERSVEIAREIGNKRNEGSNIGNLGMIYYDQGQYEEALGHFQQAVDIASEIGDIQGEGIHLGNIGLVYVKLEQWEEAKDVFHRTIKICEETYPPAAGYFRGYVAFVYAKQEQFSQAYTFLKEGEEQIRVQPLEYCVFLCNKAMVLYLAGEKEEAQEALSQAEILADENNVDEVSEFRKEIARTKEFISKPLNPTEPSKKQEKPTEDEIEDLRLEAEDLLEQGNLERAESEYEQALQYYDQALQIYQEIEDKKGEANTHKNISLIFKKQGSFDKALEELEQALELAKENGLIADRFDILNRFGEIYYRQSKYKEAMAFFQEALEGYKESNNQMQQGGVLVNIGNVYQKQEKIDEAVQFYQQGLEISKEIGNKSYESTAAGNLGNLYTKIEEYEKSIFYQQQALEIAREIDNKAAENCQLGNLGVSYWKLNELEEARKCFQQALEMAQDIGDKAEEGRHLGNLAYIYHEQGKLEDAKQALLKAIFICEQRTPLLAGYYRGTLAFVYALQDQFKEAFQTLEKGAVQVESSPYCLVQFLCQKMKVLYLAQETEEARKVLSLAKELVEKHNLGVNVDICKEIEEANAFFINSPILSKISRNKNIEKQQMIADEIEDLRLDAEEFLEEGNLERIEANFQTALQYYEKARDLYQKIGDKRGEIDSCSEIAEVLRIQGEYAAALLELKTALTIAKENNLNAQKARVFLLLGSVYFNQSNFEQALESFQKALAIFRMIQDQLKEGSTLGNIGNIYLDIGQFQKSIECYEQAIQIARNTGNKNSEGIFLGNVAIAHRSLGSFEEAILYFQQAIQIATELGNISQEGRCLGNLGLVYVNKGEFSEARSCYQQAIKIAERIGQKRNEGIFLGNLAHVYSKQDQLKESEETFIQAIEICERLYPIAAGFFLGQLSFVYAKQGKEEEAFDSLEKGELYLEEHPSQYGEFLCNKVKVLHLVGRAEEALEILFEIEEIAGKHNLRQNPDFHKAIEETKAFLSKPPASSKIG